MKFRLESSFFEDNAVVRTFSKDFCADAFSEETFIIDKEVVKGSLQELHLDHFCIITQELKSPAGYSINFSGNSALFKLHFELEGDYNYIPTDPLAPVISIPSGHFNIFYLPKPEGCLKFASSSRKTLEVLFTEELLRKIMGPDYKGLSSLKKGIKKNRPFLLWEESRYIPTELQQHIKEIMSCRYCGHIKKIYLEARITALLLNFLVDNDPKNAILEKHPIPKKEYAGIVRVEEHIRKNFSKNLTITELAPIAGLNTSKLKQCFKKVHSTTIFKYITGLRMEKAKDLITHEKLSVSEASYEVGYKNPQHFTVAFKKYYGFLPSSLN
ncbi:helix-turn-helix transcriptional regulator [Salinimicrobium tongyeongense]|uniref:Helix-turn-helix transcriptional regulator n=1 Tax=Salinimicrobium tongyeongense TaxID=2809707 RepID=A0ABY6NN37_9FLAO|nr:AraC family transcriptional regulator [Salinimicrobium tongyeongense]UZH54101.1 helix-turn-helix transcriptional regulator [Salinimicrobium tongyeongense]